MNKQIIDIGLRAMFLSERIKCDGIQTADSKTNLAQWKKMVGEDFFATRLAMEGICENRALELAGKPLCANIPEWLQWLSDFRESPLINDFEINDKNINEPVFLVNALSPIVAYGVRKFIEQTHLTDSLKELLNGATTHLIHNLISISHRCIFPELFGDAGTLYFCKGRVVNMNWFDYIFSRYPVLARLLFEKLNNWVLNIKTLFERLQKDLPSIEQTFKVKGMPVVLKMGLSDSHNGGQSVAFFEWKDGTTVVYKPHSSLSGKEWMRFLKKCGIETYEFKILEHKQYSYTEFVQYNGNGNPLKYYTHAGELLAACIILGATDMHYENLIAKGNIPVIVDTETVAGPLLGELSVGPERCGLLSVKKYIQGVCIGDWGGLVKVPGGLNIPTAPFKKEYVTSVTDGFKSVIQQGCHIYTFKHPLRCVLRSTMTYSLIQAQCLNRKRMQDGFLYSLPIERLTPILKYKKNYMNIYKYEQCSMEKLDIPYFYCFPDSKDIFAGKQMLKENFFDQSVNEHIILRANKLNNKAEIEKCINNINNAFERSSPTIMQLDQLLFKQLFDKN
ncbi:MAG: DUF4135 domain-containing protein [Bacteroidales bacterium]